MIRLLPLWIDTVSTSQLTEQWIVRSLLLDPSSKSCLPLVGGEFGRYFNLHLDLSTYLDLYF